MDNHYLKMGLTSIMIICYKDADRKPVVDWYLTNTSSRFNFFLIFLF